MTYRELIETCIQNSETYRALVSVESLANYLKEGLKELDNDGGLPLLDAILETRGENEI